MIPDVLELKCELLKELHGSNYSGHIRHHRCSTICKGITGGLSWLLMCASMCKVAPYASVTTSSWKADAPCYSKEHATMDRITQLPKIKKGHTAILIVVDRLT